jgi:hypothetical protein
MLVSFVGLKRPRRARKGYIPPQELDALRAKLDYWIQYARRLEAENVSLREENERLSARARLCQ